MFPYDVQVMGAIVMHQGNIAEMSTGEGKTLTATMPVYLNALTGQGAILVTTNEYLAKRDAEEMGQVYEFLGLTIGVPFAEDGEELDTFEKREIYASDIIYTTNSGLGFDYLIDNLASNKDGNTCVLLTLLLLMRLIPSYWIVRKLPWLFQVLLVFNPTIML